MCSSVSEPKAGAKTPFATLDTRAIQDLLDTQVQSFSHPWKASIPFTVYVLGEDEDPSSVYSSEPQDVDICDYLANGKYPTKSLYFCSKTYPPPSNDTEMKPIARGKECAHEPWLRLKRELALAAHKAGNPIVCNGGGAGKREFRCASSFRDRKSEAMEVTEENPYRSACLINNDKANRRENGKQKPRKIITANTLNKCKFSLTIKWDEYGFYVNLKNRSGNPIHEHHPKEFDPSVIPISTRLLTDEQKQDTVHVMNSSSSKAAGRNYFFSKFGILLDSLKAAYLKNKSQMKQSVSDDIENLVSDFQESGKVAFTTISDVHRSEFKNLGDNDKLNKPTEATMTVSTTKTEDGTITTTSVQDNPEIAPIENIAKQTRKERRLADNQFLFIAIAWIFLPAFRFFKLCPEVVWCDVTSHSNNKGFNLLTFSCRTSVNKQVIFFWIWIPNEQRFSFRWVFHHAAVKLIPAWLRARVRLIMKDGDPQQRNEILRALISVFPNAIEGGCGWHIGMCYSCYSDVLISIKYSY